MYPNRGRQLMRGFLIFLAAGVALIVVILVVEQIGQPSSAPEPKSLPPTYPAPSPTSSPASPPSPASLPQASTPEPGQDTLVSGPLQVIQGRQQINGVQLGWPPSTIGAVSAADAFTTEVGSTLDPDRAAAIMRLAADPSVPNGPQEAAQGAIQDRKDLGLSATGPVPSGTSMAVVPVEYQVRDMTASKMLVLLLCDTATTQPQTGTRSSYGVFPVETVWNGKDWLITPSSGGNYDNLAAKPDSPQASALGWTDLQPAEG